MSYRVFVSLLLPTLLLLSACNGGRRGRVLPADSGTTDTGTTTGDSGDGDTGIVLMDSGMTGCDSSHPCPVGQTCVSGMCQTSGCDSSNPCPVGQTCVSGMCQTTTTGCTSSSECPSGQICSGGSCVPDSTRTCDGSDVPYNTVSVCSSSTMTCITSCSDGACIQSCLDADPSTDCSACVNQNFISCLNMAACQSTWDPYVCCIEDNCGTMATSSCVNSVQTGACASSYGAWDSCTMTADVTTVCPSDGWLTDCF